MVQSSLSPEKVTGDELNSLVDRAADLIRTAVDYKFILVLLFLKRLNDLWKAEKAEVKNRLVKESGWAEEEADKEAERRDYHSVDIPKQFLWDEVTKDVNSLPQNLATGIGETAKLKGNKVMVKLNAVALPESALKYIVAHEIGHATSKRHTKTFWKTVALIYPEYKEAQQLLLRLSSVRLISASSIITALGNVI